MKANEFIKKYGIEYAIKFLNYDASIAEDRCVLDFGEYYYLKRLVESYELIESRGGLDAAKHELITLQKHLNNTFGWVTVITAEKIDRLKQAILDVESCK